MLCRILTLGAHDGTGFSMPKVEGSVVGVDALCTIAAWEENTPNCGVCQKVLGKRYMTRRHHCRMCGKCVCSSCSPSTVELDGHEGAQRVCSQCVGVIQASAVMQVSLADFSERLGNLCNYVSISEFRLQISPSVSESLFSELASSLASESSSQKRSVASASEQENPNCMSCGKVFAKYEVKKVLCCFCGKCVCDVCSANSVQLQPSQGLQCACKLCVSSVQRVPQMTESLAQLCQRLRVFCHDPFSPRLTSMAYCASSVRLLEDRKSQEKEALAQAIVSENEARPHLEVQQAKLASSFRLLEDRKREEKEALAQAIVSEHEARPHLEAQQANKLRSRVRSAGFHRKTSTGPASQINLQTSSPQRLPSSLSTCSTCDTDESADESPTAIITKQAK